jgi:lysophospholipase L1-like esterase
MASAAPTSHSAAAVTPSKPGSRGRTIAKVGLLLGSLLFAVLLLEIGLRVAGVRPQTATVLSTYFQYDAETGWRGKPSAASRFATTNFDVFVSHDSEGFRRGGYEAPLATDSSSSHRITWVLGDSGTWGWGVEDGKTYVDGLNRLSNDGTRYRNLGHCGFSSVQQYLLLKDLFGRGIKPAEVVVLFCGNDLNENLDDRDQSPARAYLKVVDGRAALMNHPTPKAGGWGFGTWLKNHSLVWNHAHYYATRAKLRWKEKKAADLAKPATAAKGGTARNIVHIPGGIPDVTTGRSNVRLRVQAGSLADMTPSPERPKVAYELDLQAKSSTEAKPALNCPPEQVVGLRHAYRLMRDLCREHGVTLYIVNDGPAVVPTVCDELGVTWFDLSKRWREYQNSAEKDQSPYFPTDPHFNEIGHRLIAEAVHAELQRLRGDAGAVLVGKPQAAPVR